MRNFLAEHWVASIFVTILLGAVGSGLWDAILRPVLFKIGKALFTILSFGRKRASDKVYKEASLGHHERSSILVLMFIFAFPLGVVAGGELEWLTNGFATKSISKQTIASEQCSGKQGTEKEDCIIASFKERFGAKFHLLSLLLLFISIIIGYEIFAISAANRVVTNFEQCLKICRPFMSAEEVIKLESHFALMKSKEDYGKIIKTLSEVANKNAIDLPKSYL
jgi:hypothetical protein